MNDERAKKDPIAYLIPLNFKQRLTFFTFSFRGIMEGIVAAAVVGIPFLLLPASIVAWAKLGTYLAIGGAAFFMVARGYYGEPFSRHIMMRLDPGRKKQEYTLRRMYSKPVKGAKQRVQDVIREDRIREGIVITKDDPARYIKILEIFPINFQNLDNNEKEALTLKLSRWYKIAPRSFQLKIITEQSNPAEHLRMIKDLMKDEPIPEVRKVGDAYIKHVQDIARRHAIAKRFFMVFSSDGLKGGCVGEDDAISKLETVARECQSFFEGNGHQVRRFRSTEEENEWLRNLLYDSYNRKSRRYDSVETRRKKFVDNLCAYHKVTDTEALLSIADSYYIAPRGLKTSKAEYVVCDGMYRITYYIEGDSLPSLIYPGWLDWPLGRGFDMDIFFSDKDSELSLSKLRSATNTASKSNASLKSESALKDYVRAKSQAVDQILQVKKRGERMLAVQIYLTATAHTIRELQDMTRSIESLAESSGMRVAPLRFRQGQAFHATQLQNRPIKEVEFLAERIIGSHTAAALYPVSAFELNDYSGFCLGQNRENKSAVFFNNFNTAQHPNANILLLGSPGYGKTFSLGVIASRTRLRGIPVFIIAPIKGVEFYRLAKWFGGTVVRISPSSTHRVNILDINIPDQESEIAISGDIVSETSHLLTKIGSMRPFFRLINHEITLTEERMIESVLREVYAEKGITEDNASLYYPGTKEIKEMPILGDVARIVEKRLETDPDYKRLATTMGYFTQGSGVGFNGHTNVDLKTGFTVLDLSELKKIDSRLVPLGMYIASNVVRGEIEEDRTKNKLLIIDEFWTMCGAASDDSASEFLLEWAKVIRGYGGAVMLASQDISDLFAKNGGSFGKGILNACKTILLHGMESQQAQEVQNIMGLTDAQTTALSAATKGEVLLCVGSGSTNRIPIKIKASELETERITTDANLLRSLANKKG